MAGNRTVARRVGLATCATLSLALALPRATALALTYAPTDLPGLMRTEEGEVAFADTILGGSRDEVVEQWLSIGERLRVEGSLGGGYGDVTVSWEHFDGDAALALVGEDGLAHAEDLAWEPVGETVIHGYLPARNDAVRAGGASEVQELLAVGEGTSVWCMTVADEVGYEHATYWLFHVSAAPGSETSGGLLPMSGSEPSTSASTVVMVRVADVADDPAPSDAPGSPESPSRDASPSSTASAAESQGGLAPAALALPRTGDGTLGLVAAVTAVAASLLLAGTLLRRVVTWERRRP